MKGPMTASPSLTPPFVAMICGVGVKNICKVVKDEPPQRYDDERLREDARKLLLFRETHCGTACGPATGTHVTGISR
jgi:hypothetical protein